MLAIDYVSMHSFLSVFGHWFINWTLSFRTGKLNSSRCVMKKSPQLCWSTVLLSFSDDISNCFERIKPKKQQGMFDRYFIPVPADSIIPDVRFVSKWNKIILSGVIMFSVLLVWYVMHMTDMPAWFSFFCGTFSVASQRFLAHWCAVCVLLWFCHQCKTITHSRIRKVRNLRITEMSET